MRVVFKRISPSGLHFIPAVNCSDFFADEMIDDDSKAFFEYAIDPNFGQWVCPDTTQIDLLNQSHQIFAMILSCEAAKSEGDSPAYTGLDDDSCSTYEETGDSFNYMNYDIYSY